MLIEFSVTNFRSIRAQQTLRMVAGPDAVHARRNVAATADKDIRLLRSAVIYGPNAAGKSNLLRALETLRQLVIGSAIAIQEGQRLPLTPFLLTESSARAPSEFEIIFLVDGTRYHYALAAGPERVFREWLVAYPKGRPQRWFEREYDRETASYTWWFGPHFRGERKQREVWKNSTRGNALFLSSAVQLNNEQLRPVFDWLTQKLIVLVPGIDFNPLLSLEMLRSDAAQSRIIRFLSAADIGIDRLELREEEAIQPLLAVPSGPGSIVAGGLLQTGGPLMKQKVFRVLAWHKRSDAPDEVAFDLGDESDGTRKLFEFAGGWLRALEWGATLFVDELDRSLHPHLTRFLVSLFNSTTNDRDAQLVFTTHDTTLLDLDLLRRDQIWFVEKDEAQSTRLYSLLDYSPRKDEALERGYLKGRYGAVPFVGTLGQ